MFHQDDHQAEELGLVDVMLTKLRWWNLGLGLTSPSQTTEIDADRQACFFSRFFLNRQSRIFSHILARCFTGTRTPDVLLE